MGYYLARRFFSFLLTLFLASVVVFAVMEIIPGDPAQIMLGLNATPEAVANLREQMGLDLPLIARYFSWIGGILHGDFGTSFTYSVPVSELIIERVWVSLPLAIMALFISTAIAIPVGVWTASRHGKASDTIAMGITQLGVAIPNFWFAQLLVFIFAVTLALVPSGGFPGWQNGFWPALGALIMPAFALALPQASILSRVARTSILEALGGDYVRTARAKGLTRTQSLWRHALRNALIPVITLMGLQFSFLLAGTIIIEQVLYLPGLGRLVFQAITQRDIIVVEGVVLLLVASVIFVNFLVDIAYAIIDPRLRARTR